MLRSNIIKRSIVVDGFYTSVSLEDVFWEELRALAEFRRLPLARLISGIRAEQAPHSNLSSAIRVTIIEHYRTLVRQSSRSAR